MAGGGGTGGFFHGMDLQMLVTFYKIQITQLLLVLVVALMDLIHGYFRDGAGKRKTTLLVLHMRVVNSVQQVVAGGGGTPTTLQDPMQMDLLEDGGGGARGGDRWCWWCWMILFQVNQQLLHL